MCVCVCVCVCMGRADNDLKNILISGDHPWFWIYSFPLSKKEKKNVKLEGTREIPACTSLPCR